MVKLRRMVPIPALRAGFGMTEKGRLGLFTHVSKLKRIKERMLSVRGDP